VLALLPKVKRGVPLRLLCIGAHSDDIEIGCGATILSWLDSFPSVDVTWVVLNGVSERKQEARRSAGAFLMRAKHSRIVFGTFQDGYLPAQYSKAKAFFEKVKKGTEPDIVLTHFLNDRHQDHKLVAELTWNTWRNHLVFEYEIPKYEGDLAQPNGYLPVSEAIAHLKVAHLERFFATQRSKGWFAAENFLALMRIRGLECRSSSGYAEAFHVRKFVL
jgi:LmbE family N-acetylglucosaminyl deacetylase